MKELHTFGWYAARIARKLPKEVFRPVPTRLFGGLAYLLIAITGILSISLFDFPFWLYFPITFVIGASFAGMGFLGHEILHGTVVRKAWLRDFLGAIAFWPLNTAPRLWRKWHNMNHHIHTQDEKKDPDSWPTFEQFSKSRIMRIVYRLPRWVRAFANFCLLSVTFSLQSLHMFVRYIKDFDVKKRAEVWLQTLLQWTTWITLLFLIGPVKWIFAFFIPLLIANFIVMLYISTNHRLNPLVPVNDPLANSLTVTVPKWIDVLHFHFSHHTEHHLFPGMSSKYYPLVKEHIKEMWPDRYHEMPLGQAIIALWKTPRVYYKNKKLIDPYVGTTYGSLGNGLEPDNVHELTKLKTHSYAKGRKIDS